jgi:hypothetical protein
MTESIHPRRRGPKDGLLAITAEEIKERALAEGIQLVVLAYEKPPGRYGHKAPPHPRWWYGTLVATRSQGWSFKLILVPQPRHLFEATQDFARECVLEELPRWCSAQSQLPDGFVHDTNARRASNEEQHAEP